MKSPLDPDATVDFVQHVRSLIDSVRMVENASFRKALYLILTDALSTLRFPDYRSPGNRFVNFVNTYGGWVDCDRVSLPQADLLLNDTKKGDATLAAVVSGRLAQWPDGKVVDLSSDPFPNELPDPMGVLRDCQHGRLLWAMRNTLLHEFRHPGYSFEGMSPGRDGPYYHQTHFVEGALAGQIGWELVVPDRFLERLALRCLDGLVAWFRSEQIDPRLIGYQGRSWVTRLRRLNPEAAGGE